MKTLLAFDLETSGLDPKTEHIVEAAGALWSIEHRSLVGSFSFVVAADRNDAEPINRIPTALVRSFGISRKDAETRIAAWFTRTDVVVAHNATFDASFLPEAVRNLRPWICTKDDVTWPRGGSGRGLRDLAADHDVGIVRAHRAAADVDILIRLFERAAELGMDINEMLAKAMRPRALFQALVSFDDNHKAKAEGFRWNGVAKRWERRMAAEDTAHLPFAVRQVA